MDQPDMDKMREKHSQRFWLLVSLGAHTGWGAYPVLARYLQTVSLLPGLSLLALSNLILSGITGVASIWRHRAIILRSPILWYFSGVVVLRAITHIFALRYTLAIYVQLVTLMTPFLVIALSAIFFRERIPPFTGRAVLLSTVGACLMMSDEITLAGIRLTLAPSDTIGITLAFISSCFLALYMVLIRRSAKLNVPGEAIFSVQLVSLAVATGLLSLLLGEDWGLWLDMGVSDWFVFLAYTFIALLGANIMQIGALRELGAPMVSSLMPWRLVSTLFISALILGERLSSPLQGSGAVVVLLSITWYLRRQRVTHNEATA
jgi:drug/metabolite transporter (DMT)-like permease